MAQVKGGNVPDRMDSHLLLTHKREKGVVDQGATDSLCCLLQ